MLKDIIEATALEGYHVHLRFEDGVVGERDLSAVIRFEGVFTSLKDLDRFRELRVHPDLGTIYWPNGADLDPAVLCTCDKNAHPYIRDQGRQSLCSQVTPDACQ